MVRVAFLGGGLCRVVSFILYTYCKFFLVFVIGVAGGLVIFGGVGLGVWAVLHLVVSWGWGFWGWWFGGFGVFWGGVEGARGVGWVRLGGAIVGLLGRKFIFFFY